MTINPRLNSGAADMADEPWPDLQEVDGYLTLNTHLQTAVNRQPYQPIEGSHLYRVAASTRPDVTDRHQAEGTIKSKDGVAPSLLSQRHDGIDFAGVASGKNAGQQRREQEHE